MILNRLIPYPLITGFKARRTHSQLGQLRTASPHTAIGEMGKKTENPEGMYTHIVTTFYSFTLFTLSAAQLHYLDK